MLHVIITGPESTGKTTLAREMSTLFCGAYIPEYARGYLMSSDRPAVLDDFENFAFVTKKMVENAKRIKPNVIIQDTGFEVLKLWLKDKFNTSLPLVDKGFREQANCIYLLCSPDLDWEYDPLRTDENRRDFLFEEMSIMLSSKGEIVHKISGKGEDRATVARNIIQNYLKQKN